MCVCKKEKNVRCLFLSLPSIKISSPSQKHLGRDRLPGQKLIHQKKRINLSTEYPQHRESSLPPPPPTPRQELSSKAKDRINLSYPVISGTQHKSQTALTKNTMSQTFARETHFHSVRNVLCSALPTIHPGAQTRGHPCAETEAPTTAMLAE